MAQSVYLYKIILTQSLCTGIDIIVKKTGKRVSKKEYRKIGVKLPTQVIKEGNIDEKYNKAASNSWDIR